MAVERTYYTIDPEGKLTCMKCKVPLVKEKQNLCIWRTVFLLRCRSVQMWLCLCSGRTGSWKVLAVERALEDK